MCIRVCKRTVIPPFSYVKVAVATAKFWLMVIEPAVDARDRLHVVDRIVEVSPTKPFSMFVSSFDSNKR